MGKLILQMNLTLDAFVADKAHNLDWMLQEEDAKHIALLSNLTKGVGHIILGRKMAEESIPYWKKVASGSSDSKEKEYAKFFVETPKIVFSKTVKTPYGANTQIDPTEISSAIPMLKQQSKKDIIVYGGASFVSSLIETRLIDELYLFSHPIAIGDGLKIFHSKTEFKLTSSEAYSNGIVFNRFELKE